VFIEDDAMSKEIPERKIRLIPATMQLYKKVAIYCHVSTTHESQEESLEIQVKTLKQIVNSNAMWRLYNVYTDKDSGGNVFRPGLQQLIYDCYENLIDVVLVKTISHFARNTVDLLEMVRKLKGLGIEVIFQQENITFCESENDIFLSELSAFAQAESESISEAIKWGLRQGFRTGKSKMYSRKCLGYKHNEDGKLIIDEEQAEVVRLIYDLYLKGLSTIGIVRELESRGIKSPQGKEIWSK